MNNLSGELNDDTWDMDIQEHDVSISDIETDHNIYEPSQIEGKLVQRKKAVSRIF